MHKGSTFIRVEDKESKLKASANETKNDSPPESEYTVRTSSPMSCSRT